MKRFNICNIYHAKFYGMIIPRNAWYGQDKTSLWVCIHKELYPLATPTLELYRFSEKYGWVLLQEQSETVNFIKQTADRHNLWGVPVEYPKFTGIHKISANMDKTITRSKKTPFKQANKNQEQRHDNEMIPLDRWEKMISRTR